ncbi:site-specific integrase [Kutzneria viridogrisea]|uniref:Integrase n=1 Tax=Kutzneria viridogrisea TaxID=47990 RepID=A0ABR6BLC5_9PSEU|nr:integrase [Kutzneria viridogrisea]
MANKKGRRRFGSTRELPSGRHQASYLGPDAQRRYAPHTFATKRDAEQWLSVIEADMLRGDWLDPLLSKVTLNAYGTRWIAERRLGVRTREEHARAFRLHIAPYLGGKLLGEISTETVRTWRATLLEEGRSEIRAAKAYKLLRSIMYTAVDDGKIKRNPCRIKGADQEHSPERPTASITQVFALADLVPVRFRALILAAGFSGLRWGELIALRRSDVQLPEKRRPTAEEIAAGADRRVLIDDEPVLLRVPRRLAQLSSGQLVAGPTKSAAGVRTVALPASVTPDLRRHLARFVKAGPEALVFTGEKGAALKRGNWRKSVKWTVVLKSAGLPEGFHFHDLRHTGNMLAAASGATTRELMHRMGHASVRAALIYQHATSERDREIANALDKRITSSRSPGVSDPEDGAAGVLVPVS